MLRGINMRARGKRQEHRIIRLADPGELLSLSLPLCRDGMELQKLVFLNLCLGPCLPSCMISIMAIRAPFGVRGDGLHALMNFLVAFPSFISMGYSQSFFGGVVGYESVYTMFPQVDTTTTKGVVKSHNALIQGVIVATLNLGAVAGCLSCMYIGNRLGRKRTTLLGAAIGVIGTLLHSTAFSTAQLVISRGMYFLANCYILFLGRHSDNKYSHTWGWCRHTTFDSPCVAIRDEQDPFARSSCYCRRHLHCSGYCTCRLGQLRFLPC
jgi:hypothetical protein